MADGEQMRLMNLKRPPEQTRSLQAGGRATVLEARSRATQAAGGGIDLVGAMTAP